MLIAYEGTNYCGWQVQPNAISIQKLIEDALSVILREEVNVVAAGRTDAGVHALGQVAHFRSITETDPYKIQHSLNGLLPLDIRILEITPASPTFHALRCAKTKIYTYHLNLSRIPDPFRRFFSLHVPYKLDLSLLEKAAGCFVGTHDFTSFANEAHLGSAAKNPVKTIYSLEIIPEKGGVRLEFKGNGFLYKMVRNIVGILLDVAKGKRHPDEIQQILNQKNRRYAGMAAPSQGLFLMHVGYEEYPKSV